MNSADLRNNVITTITNALLFPESHGDRFFVQLVTSSEQGYMPLALVHGMIKELQGVPLKYIEHCADREPDRLQLSIDRTKIRIARVFHDDPVDDLERETDAYGEQQQEKQKNKNQHQNNGTITRQSSSSSSSSYYSLTNDMSQEDEPIEQVQQKPSKYFQPYKPTFVTKRTITAPIYFNNGKFYNDEEELNKKVRQDRPRMEVPPYEKLDITALGDPRNKENMNVCWNCGSEDHRYTVCPQPRDDAMINEYRNRIKKPNGPNFGRFFVELELRNQIVTLRPGKISLELQKALGLNRRHPEPPYYTKMRQNGYPPGYWKSPKERDELLSQWKNPTAWSEEMLYDDNADLKIYSDPASYEQNDMDEDGPVKRVGTNKRVKLVHYPGLDKWENLHKRRRTTTAEPHLDYTYAPAYYLAEDSSPSIMMNDDDYTATTTPPTANFETTYHDPPNHESSIALQQQQSSVLPPEQQYQYYHYYYSAYPFFQYQLPVQEQQEQPQVWQAPSQSRLHNIPNNDELATPVSYTSNKGEEGQEEDEMDMDISDDD